MSPTSPVPPLRTRLHRTVWSRRDDGNSDAPVGCLGCLIVVLVIGGIALVIVFWRIIVAALTSLLILAGGLLLIGGLIALTAVYFGYVHSVMFRGGYPPDPAPGPTDDPAFRAYHGGPATADLAEIVRASWLQSAPWTVLVSPHMVVHAVLVGLYLAAAWTGVAVLRAVDTGLLAIRRIRITCPHCFHRLGYPGYLCAHCGGRHAAIRPGRRGLLRRECRCGTRLPTLLVLGSADLNAVCPYCDRALEHRPGEAREFPLPLFGGTGAGKTRLMHGLHLTLDQAVREGSEAYVEPIGDETRRRLGDGATALAPAHRTSPTPPGREVRGLTVRVGTDRRTLLLHLFDAAGERFNRSATAEGLTYLGKATTFVMVVDPLALEPVWRALSAGERERFGGERSHTRDPELAYEQVREEIERQYRMLRRRMRGARLAVVVTRGDLVRGTSVGPGEASPDTWAQETLGLANLLRSARAHFGRTRVFLTSSVAREDGRVDPSLHELLRWVLDEEAGAFTSLLDAAAARGDGGGR